MGGANTEIADHDRPAAGAPPTSSSRPRTSTRSSIARTARRHKLSSEASKRFERGVDPQAAAAAAQRTVDLLVLLAGGTAEAGVTEVVAPVRAAHDHHPGGPPGPGRGRRLRPRDRRPPPPGGRLRRLRAGRADRHRAVLAARPHRAQRPRRRGHPAGGLREPALHAAQAAGRPRPDRPPAAAPPGRPGAGRRRLRRGAELPVHRRAGLRPARPGRPTTRAAASSRWPTRSPTRSRRCAPRCCRVCSARCAATTAGAAHDLALFETGLVFRPPRRSSASPRGCPSTGVPPTRRSPRWTPRCPTSRGTSPSCSPGAASRPAGGARAARPTGPTRSRPRRTVAARGRRRAGRPRGPVRALAPGPLRRAAWSSSTAPSRSSATPVSCTRGWSRRSGLPARTCAMELDLDAAGARSATARSQAPADLHLPGGHAGRRAGRRRVRAGRRGRGRAARGRG